MTSTTKNTAANELLTFRIGAQEFCIDVMAVREIRGWSATTALPQAPAYVLGVLNLRGTVLPIVDLAARLGFAPCVPSPRNAIMVVEMNQQIAGLLVDGVSDILTLSEEQIQPTPQVASELARSYVRGVVALEGRLLSVIAADAVLPPAVRLAA